MEYVFDIETDDLNATRIHILSATANGIDITSTDDYGRMRKFMESDLWKIGHNISRFDVDVLVRITEPDPTKVRYDRFIDTLFLSWYLFPERGKHSLESWGETFGFPKVKVDADEWANMSYERAKERCERDVQITLKLWKRCKTKLIEMYGDTDKVMHAIKYIMHKANCAGKADRNGWWVDIDLAKKNYKELKLELDVKYEAMRAFMIDVPVYKTTKRPAKERKQDNTLTVFGERWWDLCRREGVDPETAEEVRWIESYEAPNPGSSEQVKENLFRIGWKPNEFKKSKAGNRVPQVLTQDPDRKGEVTDSVAALAANPDPLVQAFIEALADKSILEHRVPMLYKFWMQEKIKGQRLPATVGGLTNTLRFAHSGTICNLPGVDAKYGDKVRPCLSAAPGRILMGADISSLEDVTKQHFMMPYDPKYVETMRKPDYDAHLDLAIVGGDVTEEDAKGYKKDKKKYAHLVPIRQQYKRANYACTYGAFPATVAEQTGLDMKKAQHLYDTYWKRNWSLNKIAENCEVRSLQDGTRWLFNPISKLWYSLRHDKDRFSTLNQGTGAYIFDCWLGYVQNALWHLEGIDDHFLLVGQFHDEFIFEVPEDCDKEVLTKVVEDAILKVQRFSGLLVDLRCSVQFGKHYGEIH